MGATASTTHAASVIAAGFSHAIRNADTFTGTGPNIRGVALRRKPGLASALPHPWSIGTLCVLPAGVRILSTFVNIQAAPVANAIYLSRSQTIAGETQNAVAPISSRFIDTFRVLSTGRGTQETFIDV
jgi:hypothetical protein